MIFDKIADFSNNFQGKSLKARGLLFCILVIYLHILIPVERIKMVVLWWVKIAPPPPAPGLIVLKIPRDY